MNILESENKNKKGLVQFILRDAKTDEVVEVKEYCNLIMNLSKYIDARIQSGDTTYTGIVNYGAVTTSNYTPQATDTQLPSELIRKTKSTASRNNNISTITFFFNTNEANGTLKGFMSFIDGTATANSGQAFNGVAIDVTKTSSQTLTIELQVTNN